MAPIDILSDDVLHEVFAMANADYLSRPELWCLQPLRLPEVLSHVSRRWRSISTSDGTLWAVIYIHSLLALPLASMWLVRSKQAPLTITLQPLHEALESPISGANISALADLIIPHLSHTLNLSIIGLGKGNGSVYEPNNFASTLLAQLAQGAARTSLSSQSSIKRLTYIDDMRFSLSTNFPQEFYRAIFHSVQDLSMVGNAFHWDWTVSNLTRLRLHQLHDGYSLSTSQLYRVLHSSLLLRELEIDRVDFRQDVDLGRGDVETTKPLTLQHLTRLSIGVISTSSIYRILRSLSTPSLSVTSVTINYPSTGAALRTVDAVAFLLSRSPVTDLTLKLSFTRYEPATPSIIGTLTLLLQANTSLKRFTLESPFAAFSDVVLDHLAQQRLLENLVIRRSRFSSIWLCRLVHPGVATERGQLRYLELAHNWTINLESGGSSASREPDGLRIFLERNVGNLHWPHDTDRRNSDDDDVSIHHTRVYQLN